MSIEVKIPPVGESIESGVVSVWHKKSGDYVEAGEPLFTLETDKVSTEITAESAGLLETKVNEGQEVKIGEVVAVIDESATAPAKKEKPAVSEKAPPASAKSAKPSPNAEVLSPAVRRIATEEKVDPAEIAGTGKGGRVTKGDVIAHLRSEPATAPAVDDQEKPRAARAESAAAEESSEVTEEGRFTRKKMSPLRRKIAAQMVMSQQTTATLTTFNECDMSEVMTLRKKAQEKFQADHGVKLGFMSFFIKATVEALKAVPSLNGRIEGDDFITNHFYDIGVAVGTERGLVVPVLRDADRLSFEDIEKNIADFGKRAKEGKLALEELEGGTFSITNGGIFGSMLSTPIINPPQSAILGIHAMKDRPVAENGQVVIRPVIYLALSYDHRLIDGREAVQALVAIKEDLEDPARLLLEI